jgi:hypothetical protein
MGSRPMDGRRDFVFTEVDYTISGGSAPGILPRRII